MAPSMNEPVYPVAGKLHSLRDLLEVFADPAHQRDGISRFSDLHLKTGEPVHYRYDGEMLTLTDATPIRPEVAEALVLPLLDGRHVAELRKHPPQDVDASFFWPEGGLNFRINVFHDRDGLAAVLRVLPRFVPRVDRLGFPDDRVWRDVCGLSQGLVIVAGNTGSGKSTTIASLIQHINETRRVRIITLEDPVEYTFASRHALISQRELGRHVASFADGLRGALREDPDIIFVGEMRDRETAALALTAAETGHLVFSTLHTKDAKGSITRIIDMFPAERTKEITTQLSLSLSYVIGQKLVTRLDGGRRIAVEVFRNTLSVANLVRTGAWHQLYTQMETGQKEYMTTLERHLVTLVRAGEISRAEALSAANEPKVFEQLIDQK